MAHTDKPAPSHGAARGSDDLLHWPFEAARIAMDSWLWWIDRPPPAPQQPELDWTSANRVALELTTMRLRDVSVRPDGPTVLVCAPYALHSALIADFAPGHSVAQSLLGGGVGRVYLTDWRSAKPDMCQLSIDSYLADLNVAVDEIGAPVDLVGLCQGGWLSLLYAARFPAKVRRLVLTGAPVDVSVSSTLTRLVRAAPPAVFEQLVARGGGNVSGEEMLRFWSHALTPRNIETALQRSLATPDGMVLQARFERWNAEVLDLPGTYYLQIIHWIFAENRIAAGEFVALGRKLDMKSMTAPVFLLVGLDDDVVPAAQALATAGLVGTPAAMIETISEPSDHLGLFMGERTHAGAWRQIAAWLVRGHGDESPRAG